jgi:hypothetical protein
LNVLKDFVIAGTKYIKTGSSAPFTNPRATASRAIFDSALNQSFNPTVPVSTIVVPSFATAGTAATAATGAQALPDPALNPTSLTAPSGQNSIWDSPTPMTIIAMANTLVENVGAGVDNVRCYYCRYKHKAYALYMKRNGTPASDRACTLCVRQKQVCAAAMVTTM